MNFNFISNACGSSLRLFVCSLPLRKISLFERGLDRGNGCCLDAVFPTQPAPPQPFRD